MSMLGLSTPPSGNEIAATLQFLYGKREFPTLTKIIFFVITEVNGLRIIVSGAVAPWSIRSSDY